jgi:hypothetical protein
MLEWIASHNIDVLIFVSGAILVLISHSYNLFRMAHQHQLIKRSIFFSAIFFITYFVIGFLSPIIIEVSFSYHYDRGQMVILIWLIIWATIGIFTGISDVLNKAISLAGIIGLLTGLGLGILIGFFAGLLATGVFGLSDPTPIGLVVAGGIGLAVMFFVSLIGASAFGVIGAILGAIGGIFILLRRFIKTRR